MIVPLKVRQIPAFARAISPLAGVLARGDLLAAIALHGEALIEAVAVATGESPERLGALEADAFLQVVSTVILVNADFFTQRVKPALEQSLQQINTAMAGIKP
jgi:hypothetical protein